MVLHLDIAVFPLTVPQYLDSAYFFARRFAHISFMRLPCAFLWAAVKVRPLFFGVGPGFMVTVFLGGRPRRLVGLWRASIARFSLSRSAINKATICSVGI